MKINDRTLIKYATSAHIPADLEGYLFKRGQINQSFQKRWCVLKGNLFYYFEKKGDREPQGCIILEGYRIELAAEETDMFAFKIAFNCPNARSYILGTDSQANMERWMRALSCAGYDYLKGYVAELQKQLDDITETERRELMKKAMCPVQAQSPVRTNPFDDDFNLLNYGASTSPDQAQMKFSQRPFSEIHYDIYGRKIREYFENRQAMKDQGAIGGVVEGRLIDI